MPLAQYVSCYYHMCVFSGMTVWSWITSCCACPWGRLFLLLSKFFSTCSSLCRTETSWASPCPFAMPLGVIHVQLMSRQPHWLDCMHVASDIPRRHNLTANSPFLWLLQSSLPSSAAIPEPWVQALWCRCIHWDRVLQLRISIGCHFL